MATISTTRVKARLSEIEALMKRLEAERQDLLAALRVADLLDGKTGDSQSETGSSPESIPGFQLVGSKTFPQEVMDILRSGPLPRGELIKQIEKAKPEASRQVIISSLSRMVSKKQIIKDNENVYSLTNPLVD